MVTEPRQLREPRRAADVTGPFFERVVAKRAFPRQLQGGRAQAGLARASNPMSRTTNPDPGAPRRPQPVPRPHRRQPGRPRRSIRLEAPRLVPLAPEHEQAALAALAALLASTEHDYEGGDHE